MKYNLVLEARPGDFMPIDINVLAKNSENYNFLENIDAFTIKYSTFELIEMIKSVNIVPDEYLNGHLWVINDNKYRYKVLTKNRAVSLDLFLKDNILDKQKMNKFLNIFNKYAKEKQELMKKSIQERDIKSILALLFSLPYENVRNIYTYIEENIL